MEIKIGKEKLDLQWKHIIAYFISFFILLLISPILSLLFSVIEYIQFGYFPIEHYINFIWNWSYLVFLSILIFAFFILLISKTFNYFFKEDDFVSIAIINFPFISLLYLSMLILYYLTFPNMSDNLLISAFKSILGATFLSTFLYICLYFIQNKKTYSTDVIIASLTIAIIPPIFKYLGATYKIISIGAIPILIREIFNDFILAFIVITYITQKKDISNYLYGIVLLYFFFILVVSTDFDDVLIILLFFLQIFLIYALGKTLSKK